MNWHKLLSTQIILNFIKYLILFQEMIWKKILKKYYLITNILKKEKINGLIHKLSSKDEG